MKLKKNRSLLRGIITTCESIDRALAPSKGNKPQQLLDKNKMKEFNWEEMEVRQSADGRYHLWWVVGRIRIDPALCWCPVSYSSTLPTFPHDHRQTNICTGWPRWPLDNEWVHRQSPICWINDGHDDDFRDPHYQTLPPPDCHLSLIPRKTLTIHLNFAFLRNC